jgi:AcrR family transcriptional regulator
MRQEWHDERRMYIVRTAEELFRIEGYETVTMARIAGSCGMATGTLYNYYSSKPALLVAIFDARLAGLTAEACPASIEEWVRHALKCYMRYTRSEWRSFLSAFYSDQDGQGFRSWQTQARIMESLGRLVSSALPERGVPAGNQEMTGILFGVFFQGFLRWLNSGQEDSQAISSTIHEMQLVLDGFSYLSGR